MTEPTLNPTPRKKWYQSKTVWAGLVTIVLPILKANGIEVPESVTEVLIGAGLVFSSGKRISWK